MTVQFIKLVATRRRYRPGRASTLDWAFLEAEVDGFRVVCRARRGWGCACADPGCKHPDQVAELVHPDLLAELEGNTNTEKENHSE